MERNLENILDAAKYNALKFAIFETHLGMWKTGQNFGWVVHVARMFWSLEFGGKFAGNSLTQVHDAQNIGNNRRRRERENVKGSVMMAYRKKKGSMRIDFGVVSSRNNKIQWTGVMAQLTERSLLIPEDPGSNPVMCNFLKKIGHSRPFFFIFFFWTQLAINKCSIKVCRWLDLNHGSRCWRQQLYQLSPTTTAHVQLLFTINCL